jgi:CRP/FNR family transcriptional regulator
MSIAASVAELRTDCCSCLLRGACPPCGLPGLHPKQLFPPQVYSRQRLAAGQVLYRKGDAFVRLHAVRTGSLKSSLTLADGRTQVAGFHLPGDVVGLDGVANDRHQSTVTALEDSQTCALDYGLLLELAQSLPAVQRDLYRLMSREASKAQWHLLMLGSMSAPERLAALLLSLSRHAAARGYSPHEFNVRMTRSDIGSYLGITAETVCRLLGDFKAMNLLEVDTRHIRFVDLPAFARTYSATVGWSADSKVGAPLRHRPALHAKLEISTAPSA